MIEIAHESGIHAHNVFEVNRRAFEREDEAQLVARICASATPRISLVALDGAAVRGHILLTPVRVSEAPGLNAWGLGPMCVVPEHQRRGIGAGLIEAGLTECRARNVDAVFVLGHAEYYPRFGFVPAGPRGFHYETLEFDQHFFVYELNPGALQGKQGWVEYDPAFSGV